MTAIITTPFRVLNAENFKEDVQDANNHVYVGIGKSDAWSNAPSDLTDTTAFAPGDHIDDINVARSQLIGLKRVENNDISHVIPREDYADGKTFVAWDSDDAEIYDRKFYCLTNEFKVYKCLKAGAGATSSQPTGTDTAPITDGGDGYHWQYMYTVTTADSESFLTNSFMPVKTLAMTISGTTASTTLATTSVDYPQQKSQVDAFNSTTAAGLHRIEITNGGSFSSGSSAPTVSITGDGTGATATATMNSAGTAVESITVTAKGTNYTVADITFSAGDAEARAVIAPKNGHGTDPVAELGGFFIGINAQLDGAVGGDITVNNDFRQIVILKNPLTTAGAILDVDSAKGLKYLQIAGGTGNADLSGYTTDALITGGTSGAKAYLVEIDDSLERMYYYQNEKTGYGTFANNETISSQYPTNTGTDATTASSGAVVAAEFDKTSGQLIFLENRNPINRSASQIEDIKCIIEF